MKIKIKIAKHRFALLLCLVNCLFLFQLNLNAQDSTRAESPAAPAKVKPVKNTFESVWIIDDQTVMVPVKGTMELDFQHRMGKVNNGSKDLWGLYGSSANIRLGVTYSPVKKLNVGIGITKTKMLLDLNAKYSIITQTKGRYPVSVTWFGDAADDTQKDPVLYDGAPIKHNSDRYSFFNQLIIARKISDRLSLQVSASWSHQNAVSGYYTSYDTSSKTYSDKYKSMENEHFAFEVAGRYKFSNVCSVVFNYDQPITIHSQHNPNPNMSLGLEVNTSSHTFQVFLGNFNKLNPQQNNLYNSNNPFNGKRFGWQTFDEFMIGFNITRLWNY